MENEKNNFYIQNERQNRIDTLTGISNGAGFIEEVRKKLDGNQIEKYCMISVDIDKFKYINNTHGYDAGDKVLRDVADALREKLTNGELYARSISDHFFIFTEGSKNTLIEKKLTQIIQYFENMGSNNKKVHFSFGIYKIPKEDNKDDIAAMISKAELARKSIKGKCDVIYSYYKIEMLSKILREKQIENEMYQALEKEEFELYIQPQYDVKTLKIVGGEAFVCWNSKRNGFMVSDDFIPLFEKNRFILELDFWMIEEICKKIKEWLDNGFSPVRISVNHSANHFNDQLYIERMKSIIQKYSIPPKLITLELKESAFIETVEEAVLVEEQLRQLGFVLAIDDFGNGYSSLNLLRDFSFDILKIDKSFISEIAKSDKSRLILGSIIQLAKKLNIETIAEGVETMKQFEYLKENCCDTLQGFLYAKPLKIDEFESRALS